MNFASVSSSPRTTMALSGLRFLLSGLRFPPLPVAVAAKPVVFSGEAPPAHFSPVDHLGSRRLPNLFARSAQILKIRGISRKKLSSTDCFPAFLAPRPYLGQGLYSARFQTTWGGAPLFFPLSPAEFPYSPPFLSPPVTSNKQTRLTRV